MRLFIYNIEPDPNPANYGNYIIKGKVVETETNETIVELDPNGVSLFEWWATKSQSFRDKYVNEFVPIMLGELLSEAGK
jgi:hypothetical protein